MAANSSPPKAAKGNGVVVKPLYRLSFTLTIWKGAGTASLSVSS